MATFTDFIYCGFCNCSFSELSKSRRAAKTLTKPRKQRVNCFYDDFAAGIFAGILTGTKMIDGMASAMVSIIHESLASYLPVLVAVTSMPLSLVFTPDAYYFGVLPIISQTASNFGIDPIEIGRAAILGQMTTGFPLSPFNRLNFYSCRVSGCKFRRSSAFYL